MKKCIFLDRDGTINVEKDYLHKVKDFEWEEKAKEAIKILKEKGFMVVVVTNQSGVGRGYYGEKDVEKLHEYMDEELDKIGTAVDGYYFCPHHPKGVGEYKKKCNCRKPNTGMFEQAKIDFDIDFEQSYMVGDKRSDLSAANRLQIKAILVETGYGEKEKNNIDFDFKIYKNLFEFAESL